MNRLHLVPAAAVGVGIAASIQATAARPDAESEDAWIFFCGTAADEAYAAVLRDPPPAPARARGSIDRLLEDLGEPLDGEIIADEPPEPMTGDALKQAAHSAAAFAFLANLPPLTNRRRIRAYIACLAIAITRSYVTTAVGNKLLYAAQTALSAHPKRASRAGKRRKQA